MAKSNGGAVWKRWPCTGSGNRAADVDHGSSQDQLLSRHNLGWLLASLVMAVAPHVPRLPPWVSVLFAAIALWRLDIARRRRPLPGKGPLLLLTALTAGGIYMSYGTLFGRNAGVAMLTAMLVLKLMEARTLRDCMVVVFIAYFLVITNFLFSQSVPTALYLLAVVLAITAALIGLNHPRGALRWAVRLRLAAALLLQAVPAMVLLFVLFPRVPGPLWGLPRDAFGGRSGLSDTMSPGSISRLGLSDEVAFRVKFAGDVPRPSELYWRGPVLWDFNGRTWSAGKPVVAEGLGFTGFGAPLRYVVTLEPDDQRWLFAIDLPASTPPGASVTADYQLLAAQPVRQRLRYGVTSYPAYRTPLRLSASDRARALRLPRQGNPRALQLAARWRAQSRSDEEIVSKALAMFHDAPFFYTLNPPLLGANPVDGFLFGSRSGFCEHYAGSFAFLMRAAGIPARVVTGYQGGEINPLGGYLIVRQADAHAWVEVWLKGRGWVRVDPTAAVAPQRVESGIATALPASDIIPGLLSERTPWLRELRMSWDAVNNGWNQWILGYNQQRQLVLLSRLWQRPASWQELGLTLAAAMGALLLGLGGLTLWRTRVGRETGISAIYGKFCTKTARLGMKRRPSEGPADFARRIARRRPDLAEQAALISGLYIRLRYGQGAKKEEVKRLRQMVRGFPGRRG